MARRTGETPTEDELARVFGAPPDGFTSERDSLARELRGAGRSTAAAAVKALRRPPLAVWVVNQLARRHPGETTDLLEAGTDLAAAQRKALGGGGAQALRAASERERSAVAALAALGGRLLTASGHPGEPTLQRVRRTLHALPTASAGEREQVRGGVLDHEIEPAAFGALLDGDGASPAPARPGPAPARPKAGGPAAAGSPRDARAAAAERQRRREQAGRAKAAVADAEKGARAEERRSTHLAQEAARAQARVAAAERELETARAAGRTADAAAREASAAAAAARSRLDEARRALEEIAGGA